LQHEQTDIAGANNRHRLSGLNRRARDAAQATGAMSLTFQKAKQLRAKLLKNFPTVYLCFD
jgi:hypothetical protein